MRRFKRFLAGGLVAVLTGVFIGFIGSALQITEFTRGCMTGAVLVVIIDAVLDA